MKGPQTHALVVFYEHAQPRRARIAARRAIRPEPKYLAGQAR